MQILHDFQNIEVFVDFAFASVIQLCQLGVLSFCLGVACLFSVTSKATEAEEELLLGSDGDGSSMSKLEPFVIFIVNNFVFVVFVKIKLNIPFYLSSIWVWNRITRQKNPIIAAACIVESFHEVQVKGLSRQRPHEDTEKEEQKLCYTCYIADEIHEAICNDGVIHACFTEPQPKLVHLTFLLLGD